MLRDSSAADRAQQRANAIAETINKEYYDAQTGCYAFSRNPDGSLDRTVTIFPALAWWDTAEGKGIFAHPERCLEQFVGSALNTDWGVRDVSNQEKIYDGMSYHQGSVWPLFTGWAAMAAYRGGQPLAGYQLLMENANLTRTQDLGAVTELLSGDLFVPFGRSTSHQLWSSAMVITPTLRGLFGIAVDAQSKTITVNPRLPASWDHAEVLNLFVADGKASLYFTQKNGTLDVYLSAPKEWHLRSDIAGATSGPLESSRISGERKGAMQAGLRIPLPELDVDFALGDVHPVESVQDVQPILPPTPGARTSRFRVLRSDYTSHKLVLTVEGLAGSSGILNLIRRGHFVPKVETESDESTANISFRSCDADPYACSSLPLVISFPQGTGWKQITIMLSW